MPMLTLALLILALICFLIGAVNVQPPGTRQINWPSAGLALLVLVYMIRS